MEGKKNVTKKKVNDLKKGNDSKKNTYTKIMRWEYEV